MSIISFLYRYVFRGIGLVLVIGMITILILAINFLSHQPADGPAVPPVNTGLRK